MLHKRTAYHLFYDGLILKQTLEHLYHRVILNLQDFLSRYFPFDQKENQMDAHLSLKWKMQSYQKPEHQTFSWNDILLLDLLFQLLQQASTPEFLLH